MLSASRIAFVSIRSIDRRTFFLRPGIDAFRTAFLLFPLGHPRADDGL